MDWMNWKTWSVVGLIIVAAFAIYTFAATDSARIAGDDAVKTPRATTAPKTATTRPQAPLPGVMPVHVEWLDAPSGSYRSERNLFSYVEPPPPPAPKPPPPPPDKDKDGVPDAQDNCPDVANSDQKDIDLNRVGDACQTTPVNPPPPPAPVPPPFNYKYIGTFGTPGKPIATFAKEGEIINVRPGETFAGQFILRSIGLESVEIGYVGFPPDQKLRVALGQ